MDSPPRATAPAYTVLHSQARELVYRVNKYFLHEKANRAPLLPVTQARKRTADAAGISEATVKRICSKENKKKTRLLTFTSMVVWKESLFSFNNSIMTRIRYKTFGHFLIFHHIYHLNITGKHISDSYFHI